MATTISFPVEGLSCASCVSKAEAAMNAVPGVRAAKVNLLTKHASAEVEPGHAGDVSDALRTAGYPATPQQVVLNVTGMSCASCVGRIEKTLKGEAGVLDAQVNLATGQARVTVLGEDMADDLARVVTTAGYAARPAIGKRSTIDRQGAEAADLRRDVIVAAALTLPVFLVEMGGHAYPPLHHWIVQTIGQTVSWWGQFVLITLVLLFPGRRFFTSGVPALLRRVPDMNTLVALGAFAAWVYSTAALLIPQVFPPGTRAVYFEAAAVIVTLILLGRWLEARAKGRTGAAIAALAGLRPDTVRVVRNGSPLDLPLGEVVVGDIIHLRPGERVPVDAKVTDGDGFVDEAMLTGEPEPVRKMTGDTLTGGTVNGAAALTLRATAVGSDTVLSRIIDMVETAQGSKLPLQAAIDRVTSVFVPIVLGIAAATIAFWLAAGAGPGRALVAGVSVLIVACPCAMGLAVPTSVMVGIGRAAGAGVLFRQGEALQRAAEVRVVAFDKTGTLTRGEPAVTSASFEDTIREAEVWPLLAAVEARSEHPLGKAIHAMAETEANATDVTADIGRGVSGTVGDHRVLIGSDGFLHNAGITVSNWLPIAEETGARGETPVFAGIDGRCIGVIGISDPLKPEAADLIAALNSQGLHVAMITGDDATTARAIADQLGIKEVAARVRPEGKADAIKALQAAYGTAAFVGDGINDAPALAQADVGIGIGTGTDVAIEAADIVLMSGDLRGVGRALAISRASRRNIRQNLFWAFAYNTFLLPVAALGMLSPMLAAGAMALSSVCVVTNALRLRTVKLEEAT